MNLPLPQINVPKIVPQNIVSPSDLSIHSQVYIFKNVKQGLYKKSECPCFSKISHSSQNVETRNVHQWMN